MGLKTDQEVIDWIKLWWCKDSLLSLHFLGAYGTLRNETKRNEMISQSTNRLWEMVLCETNRNFSFLFVSFRFAKYHKPFYGGLRENLWRRLREKRNITRSTTSEISSPEEKRESNLGGSEASNGEGVIDSALTVAKGVGDKMDFSWPNWGNKKNLKLKFQSTDEILQNMNNRITDEVKPLDLRARK